MIIGKFFSLLAKWLDTAIKYVEATFRVIVSGVQTFLKKVETSINSCPITIPDKMTVRFEKHRDKADVCVRR